jgi:hypothetical protein
MMAVPWYSERFSRLPRAFSLPMLNRSMDEATLISSTLSEEDLKPTASEISAPTRANREGGYENESV